MPTLREIEAAKTPKGGYTKAQLAAWGLPWPPPKGWKDILTAQSHIPTWIATVPGQPFAHWWFRDTDGILYRICDQDPWPDGVGEISATEVGTEGCTACMYLIATDITRGDGRIETVFDPPHQDTEAPPRALGTM